MASPHLGQHYWNAVHPAYSNCRAVYKILLYVFGWPRRFQAFVSRNIQEFYIASGRSYGCRAAASTTQTSAQTMIVP